MVNGEREKDWVIVTDAHVGEAFHNCDDFFAMLARFDQLACPVVFLGDIFDLWVGIAKLELPEHRRFIDWCNTYRTKAPLGFIEGNHEYFVLDRHAACFTFSSPSAYLLPTLRTLFIHGDLINPDDKSYLLMRWFFKNPVTRFFFRWMPFSSYVVRAIKNMLTKPKDGYGKLPKQAIQDYAKAHLQSGTDLILCGHFHSSWQFLRDEGRRIVVLPAWLNKQEVGLLNPHTLELRSLNWRELTD